MHRDRIAIKVMKRFLELLLFIYVIAMPPGLGSMLGLTVPSQKMCSLSWKTWSLITPGSNKDDTNQ